MASDPNPYAAPVALEPSSNTMSLLHRGLWWLAAIMCVQLAVNVATSIVSIAFGIGGRSLPIYAIQAGRLIAAVIELAAVVMIWRGWKDGVRDLPLACVIMWFVSAIVPVFTFSFFPVGSAAAAGSIVLFVYRTLRLRCFSRLTDNQNSRRLAVVLYFAVGFEAVLSVLASRIGFTAMSELFAVVVLSFLIFRLLECCLAWRVYREQVEAEANAAGLI